MTAETFFQLFNQYGLILVCAVVFCEYMNLPGFPAGVIMPCVGVLIARSELSLPLTVFLSVVAGVLGSLVIYAVCYWGGEPVMEKLFGRSKKFKSLVRKCHEFIDAQHGRGLAIIRVIPCIRTIVSIPAGLLRMPVKWFIGWSAAGVEYRAHFVRVFLQREDSQHGNVTKYIDRVNPRICPVFAFFGRKMGASIL